MVSDDDDRHRISRMHLVLLVFLAVWLENKRHKNICLIFWNTLRVPWMFYALFMFYVSCYCFLFSLRVILAVILFY